jgi:hypothetical protein
MNWKSGSSSKAVLQVQNQVTPKKKKVEIKNTVKCTWKLWDAMKAPLKGKFVA